MVSGNEGWVALSIGRVDQRNLGHNFTTASLSLHCTRSIKIDVSRLHQKYKKR